MSERSINGIWNESEINYVSQLLNLYLVCMCIYKNSLKLLWVCGPVVSAPKTLLSSAKELSCWVFSGLSLDYRLIYTCYYLVDFASGLHFHFWWIYHYHKVYGNFIIIKNVSLWVLLLVNDLTNHGNIFFSFQQKTLTSQRFHNIWLQYKNLKEVHLKIFVTVIHHKIFKETSLWHLSWNSCYQWKNLPYFTN